MGVTPPGGTTLSVLTPDPIDARRYVWSPDGTRLAAELITTPGASVDLFLIEPTGGEPVPFAAFANSTETRPIWSPDGAWIAYHRIDDNDCDSFCGLWVMAPDGSGNHRVLRSPLLDQPIVWTADSRELFVARWTGQADGERGFVDIETSGFRQFPGTGTISALQPISPDGRYVIIAGRTTLNEPGVVVTGIDGGSRKQVHPDSLIGMQPVWRP